MSISSITDKDLKSQIMEAIKSQDDKTLSISEIQERVLTENNIEVSDVKGKKKIASLIDELSLGGKVSVDGDNISKTSKKSKRGRDGTHDSNNNNEEENDELKRSAKKAGVGSGEAQKLELWKNGEKAYNEGLLDSEYISNNPDRITRLFVGNLHRKITDEQMKSAIDGIVYIKWMTDKQSGQFYGSTFVEMKSPSAAAAAVQKDKQKLMGRPLKIYYCPPRPGDVWPPKGQDHSSSRDGAEKLQAIQRGARREKTEKPEGCRKLFMGNLSYEIDDDKICEFFKDCGEMVGLRWLCHKDSGDFKGAGYVEFASAEAADEAFKLDGQFLLGRPIRLDWTA